MCLVFYFKTLKKGNKILFSDFFYLSKIKMFTKNYLLAVFRSYKDGIQF